MEATAILNSNYLDILFDGRNKEYGGYQLRLRYNKRVLLSLLYTTAITLGVISFSKLSKDFQSSSSLLDKTGTVVIRQIDDRQQKVVQPPPKKIPAVIQPLQSTKLTTITIREDDKVKDVIPPVQDIARVDVVSKEGVIDERVGMDLPQVQKGIIETPKVTDDGETIFFKVEIEATTNIAKWRRYLENNLMKYIEQAISNGMAAGTYTVQVRFLVEKDGTITDVHALNDPGFGLGSGAEDVIRKGPQWSPGEQNGRKVRSYHTQPVTFVLSEQ
ncbi:MAG: energy transducer TonB [Candidatus Dadabacteria bacterium]